MNLYDMENVGCEGCEANEANRPVDAAVFFSDYDLKKWSCCHCTMELVFTHQTDSVCANAVSFAATVTILLIKGC